MGVDPDGTDGKWGILGYLFDYFAAVPLAFCASRVSRSSSLYNSINGVASSVGKIGTSIGIGLTLVEAGFDIYNGISSGKSAGRVISDAVVDAGIGLGTIFVAGQIGTWLGSAVPVAGNLIGFVAGVFVGAITWGVDKLVPEIGEGIKEVVYDFAEIVYQDIISPVVEFVKDIGKTLRSWFTWKSWW